MISANPQPSQILKGKSYFLKFGLFDKFEYFWDLFVLGTVQTE
jgi:hypothetical protein